LPKILFEISNFSAVGVLELISELLIRPALSARTKNPLYQLPFDRIEERGGATWTQALTLW